MLLHCLNMGPAYRRRLMSALCTVWHRALWSGPYTHSFLWVFMVIIGTLEEKVFGVLVEFNRIWWMILDKVLGELSMYLILSQCDPARWSESQVCADLTRSLPSQAYPLSLI